MILSTTPSIEGKKITKYLGVISGEAIMGANIFKDLFATVRDIVGGRSATYEKELHKAKDLATGEIIAAAEKLGANAIVGIDLDYETMGANGGMLMVSISGTAVVIE
ncbi:MAG: heavy metal-binding domain-containing protein [Parcubacteria group bacterium]|nr:heavy metal-binding domain-containing protein [Parcubacteria group bacterium]